MADETIKNGNDKLNSQEYINRKTELLKAQNQALSLLEKIESKKILRPGITELDATKEIFELAKNEYGIVQHWHKQIVRSGPNTLCTFDDISDSRTIAEGDLVFVDLGPVFEGWEADIGQTYLIGNNTEKAKLVADLPLIFNQVSGKLKDQPEITGAELYQYAHECSEKRGWLFGGHIAGHIVGEFSHFLWAGRSRELYISPLNKTSLSGLDPKGRARHWIIEIHLTDQSRSFGGFYERLALS